MFFRKSNLMQHLQYYVFVLFAICKLLYYTGEDPAEVEVKKHAFKHLLIKFLYTLIYALSYVCCSPQYLKSSSPFMFQLKGCQICAIFFSLSFVCDFAINFLKKHISWDVMVFFSPLHTVGMTVVV